MIYDLSARIRALKGSSTHERMVEAAETLPSVGIVALNGIPFIGDPPTYFGVPVTPESLHSQFLLGLGFGGLLTFMNPQGHDLGHLADLSLDQGHDWALHAMMVTLCFAGCPTFVEMSFARDGRFHLSWTEPKKATNWNHPRVFTASASLKTWTKYLANRSSEDFRATQREWLGYAHLEMASIFPECFR